MYKDAVRLALKGQKNLDNSSTLSGCLSHRHLTQSVALGYVLIGLSLRSKAAEPSAAHYNKW